MQGWQISKKAENKEGQKSSVYNPAVYTYLKMVEMYVGWSCVLYIHCYTKLVKR